MERTTETVLTTVSVMDQNTTAHVALVLSWKGIFATAQVKKKMKGSEYAHFTNFSGGHKLKWRNS